MPLLTTSIQDAIGKDVIVFIGAPCSGKTTQSKVLSETLEKPSLAPGTLFRIEIANGTELGQQLKKYIDLGETIPNDLTKDFLTAKLKDPLYENGVILDGHPRSLSHLRIFDDTLTELNKRIFAAIYLDVPTSELDKRRNQRGRNDDNSSTANRRYELFMQDTIPLVNFFDQTNRLITIYYSTETPEEISQQILTKLNILAQNNIIN